MSDTTKKTWNGSEDVERWNREMVALVEEFNEKSPSIGRWQACLDSGARVTVEAPGQWKESNRYGWQDDE